MFAVHEDKLMVKELPWNEGVLIAVEDWLRSSRRALTESQEKALVANGVSKRIDGVLSLNALGWKYAEHLKSLHS